MILGTASFVCCVSANAPDGADISGKRYRCFPSTRHLFGQQGLSVARRAAYSDPLQAKVYDQYRGTALPEGARHAASLCAQTRATRAQAAWPSCASASARLGGPDRRVEPGRLVGRRDVRAGQSCTYALLSCPGLAEAPSRPSRESLKNAESRRVASRSK